MTPNQLNPSLDNQNDLHTHAGATVVGVPGNVITIIITIIHYYIIILLLLLLQRTLYVTHPGDRRVGSKEQAGT